MLARAETVASSLLWKLRTSRAKRAGVDQVTLRRRLDKLLESGLIRLGVLVDYSRI